MVNGNAVYQLPFGLGKPMLNQRGIASAIAGNWQLTTTALARTGFPVNVLMPSSYIAPDGNSGTQRPDLVPGVSLTPPGGRTSRSGSIPQPLLSRLENSATRRVTSFAGRAPGRSISAPARRLPLRERAQLEFRAEFYNIFNHPQLGQPQVHLQPLKHHRVRQHHQHREPEHRHRLADHSCGFGNAARDPVRAAAGLLTNDVTNPLKRLITKTPAPARNCNGLQSCHFRVMLASFSRPYISN